MKYKAIICDVDGTLIPNKPDGIPSYKVTEAIAKVKNAIHVGIATSRPYWMAKPIMSHLQLSGPCIVNGATQIIDPVTERILFEQQMSQESFQKAVDILYTTGIKFHVNDGGADITYMPGLTLEKPINIYADGFDITVAEKLEREIAQVADLNVHKIIGHTAGKVALEVTHLTATKQHGVAKVAEILNISASEIIGIGDSYNDFPLLMACGLKVAMGNAVEDLKAIADYIAPPVEEDGVADVIEKFILQ